MLKPLANKLAKTQYFIANISDLKFKFLNCWNLFRPVWWNFKKLATLHVKDTDKMASIYCNIGYQNQK